MATNSKLKAYVRYDGTGRVIAGGPILQRFKPKVGNWKQIGAYECCDPSCSNLVYGDDYIVANIEPYGETDALITVLINPVADFAVQGGLFDCDGKLISESTVLGNLFPADNLWIFPAVDLFASCSIQFRKICLNGTAKSGWTPADIGG